MLQELRNRFRRSSQAPDPGPQPAILMYHRVAVLDVDPWELAVTPERFARQLDHLLHHRTPMPLDAFVARLDEGSLPRDAVAITFDDGYADNFHAALPLLAERNLSATLFLVSRCIDRPTAFWWDELARLILLHPERMDAELTIGFEQVAVRWDRTERPSGTWRAFDPPGDGREIAYLHAWRILRALPEHDRVTGIAQLRALLGPADGTADRTMERSELEAFVASGTFSIGAHSVTHAALSTLDPQAAAAEIRLSKAECEALTREPVIGFAYPYGDMNRQVRDLVASSDFCWACSTEAGPVPLRGYDRFALPRIGVGNWDCDRFLQALACP